MEREIWFAHYIYSTWYYWGFSCQWTFWGHKYETMSFVWNTWFCFRNLLPMNQALWKSGWWFGTFFISHHIWDNPSHWLSYFSRWLKPPIRYIYIYTYVYIYIYRYMYIYNTFKMVKTTSQKCMCLPFHWALEFPAEFHGGVHGSQAATGWSGWPPPYFAPGVPCALRRTARGKCSARWNIRCHGRKLWRGWGRNQRMDMIWYDIFIYI